jgi:PilZ domain
MYMQTWGNSCVVDRRNAVRRNVRTRLRIRIWKSSFPEQRAESLNLSERGIYFLTRATLGKDETVEVLLKMPEEISGESPTEWRCIGRVVRVEGRPMLDGKTGVAVAFHHCEPLYREASDARRIRALLISANQTARTAELQCPGARQ